MNYGIMGGEFMKLRTAQRWPVSNPLVTNIRDYRSYLSPSSQWWCWQVSLQPLSGCIEQVISYHSPVSGHVWSHISSEGKISCGLWSKINTLQKCRLLFVIRYRLRGNIVMVVVTRLTLSKYIVIYLSTERDWVDISVLCWIPDKILNKYFVINRFAEQDSVNISWCIG